MSSKSKKGITYQSLFEIQDVKKRILSQRFSSMLSDKVRRIAASKIQKAIGGRYKYKTYNQGYRYLDYDSTYKKIYKCPVYLYEWDPKFKSHTLISEDFINGYDDKLNEIRNDVKEEYLDVFPRCVYPNKTKVIAIGDIHGDWRALTYSLEAAKVIDENGKWVGGSTYVVQLGDCTDRYRALDNSNNGSLTTKTNEKSEQKILRYLWDLDEQAKVTKGRVITLVGNHEIMNTTGSKSYVSPLGRTNFDPNETNNEFAMTTNVKPINKSALENREDLENYNWENTYNNYPNIHRSKMWKPGSKYSKLYSKYPAILKIGNNLYMHGGLNFDIATNLKGNLEHMNMYMWCYLNNKLGEKELEKFQYIFGDKKNPLKKGILYYKMYSRSLKINGKQTGPLCDDLKKTLSYMNCKKMIVAHVPQANGIQTNCNHCVVKTNVAMSEAFGRRWTRVGRIPQVLKIQNNKYIQVFSKREINNAFENSGKLKNKVRKNMNNIVANGYERLLVDNS